jgi:hypothetical protein
MKTTDKEAIERGLRILWIIWAAMFGSLLIYVFICHQLGEDMRPAGSPDFPIDLLKNILYIVAIVTLALTHFIRKLMLAGRFGGSDSRLSKNGAASGTPSFVARYTAALIVSLALSESIGIYGLVLFLLGANFQTLYIFIGVSAAAMFFYRPKKEELESLAIDSQTKGTPNS